MSDKQPIIDQYGREVGVRKVTINYPRILARQPSYKSIAVFSTEGHRPLYYCLVESTMDVQLTTVDGIEASDEEIDFWKEVSLFMQLKLINLILLRMVAHRNLPGAVELRRMVPKAFDRLPDSVAAVINEVFWETQSSFPRVG